MHPSSERLFDSRVIDTVKLIPCGRLATYGQIADLIGAFGCARQVGWHHLVNARGCIAMTLSRAGTDWIQREMLIAEGIPVDAEGRLPLKQYLWRPNF